MIAVGNGKLLFCHEEAFLNQADVNAQLTAAMNNDFEIIEVPASKVSVQDAVQSYLFNSQLLSKPDGSTLLVIPEECEKNPAVWNYLQELVSSDASISELKVFDLKQSMSNGGGPAAYVYGLP